jgi:hypothetical protein
MLQTINKLHLDISHQVKTSFCLSVAALSLVFFCLAKEIK